jgi:hypothetical protein
LERGDADRAEGFFVSSDLPTIFIHFRDEVEPPCWLRQKHSGHGHLKLWSSSNWTCCMIVTGHEAAVEWTALIATALEFGRWTRLDWIEQKSLQITTDPEVALGC